MEDRTIRTQDEDAVDVDFKGVDHHVGKMVRRQLLVETTALCRWRKRRCV